MAAAVDGAGAPAVAGDAELVAALVALGIDRIISLNLNEKKFAVVMRQISGDDRLVLQWVHMQHVAKYRWKPGFARIVTSVDLDRWTTALLHTPEVSEALTTLDDPLRAQVHLHVVESVVADFVVSLTMQGLLVPSGSIVRKAAELLELLPPAAAVTKVREKLLRRDRGTRRWSERFRLKWDFVWGQQVPQHSLGDSAVRRRAGVYFRWMRHVFEVRGARRHTIVVNMDETMLSNVKSFKHGVRGADTTRRALESRPRERALPRTSLLACIASDPAVQSALPQLRLQKSDPDVMPSLALRQAHSAAEAPVSTMYGTGGWVTSRIMTLWLGRLLRAVRSRCPECALVVVLDCCPSHMSDDTLKAAERLGIDLVFVPARLTWLLQPLDTHVFAIFKRSLRQAEFDTKVALGKTTLTPLERVEMQGRVIRSTFVERTWSEIMVRAGATGDVISMRPRLRNVLEGQDLGPSPPTAAELSDLLNVTSARAVQIRRSLLRPVPVPRRVRFAAAAAASSSASSGAAMPGPAPSAVAPEALPRLRRLPRRPAHSASSGPLVPEAPPHSGPVTRSALRASLSRGDSLA